MIVAHLRRVIVAFAGQAPRGFDIAKPQAWRRNRRNRFLNAIAVHRLDGMLRRPYRCLARYQQRTNAVVTDDPDVVRRQNVMMDVNSMRMHGMERSGRKNSLWNGSAR